MLFPFQNQCSDRTKKYGILDAISYMAGTSAGAKVTLQSTQLTSQSCQHMVEGTWEPVLELELELPKWDLGLYEETVFRRVIQKSWVCFCISIILS